MRPGILNLMLQSCATLAASPGQGRYAALVEIAEATALSDLITPGPSPNVSFHPG